jgi:hypothetical protein
VTQYQVARLLKRFGVRSMKAKIYAKATNCYDQTDLEPVARSMPEGPTARGSKRTRAQPRAERSTAKSIDGDERGGSIKVVMAGRTR